ncbi:MAG TPA: GNAT family N-acetyltransferase [Phycisphaerae bacterium]|nr:GNAT family N-acetyltransferase [Phycisphaerae bacterium]
MDIRLRTYRHPDDYEAVGKLLVRTYRMPGPHRNWPQPRWEYMHAHPLCDESRLGGFGVWERDGGVVGIVHHEHRPGVVYVELAPACAFLKPDMLAYAAENLGAADGNVRSVEVFINDADEGFQRIAAEAGFERNAKRGEDMSHLPISDPFPPIRLPEGFHLRSLADENDLHKVHRVLHRGFNHPGEPPADGIEGMRKMQSAPNFRPELTIVVEAPGGEFVSYCGMWYEAANGLAYVEPVCTDPDYRRRGLGTAAVLEAIRRCGALGATVACVGTTKPFYLSMGFKQVYATHAWRKEQADCTDECGLG